MAGIPAGDTLTQRTSLAIREALEGRRRGWLTPFLFAGPAVIVSIAYIDPGNFATNIQAGARYGYGLLWVVVLANLIAMLFQALSAKLGIVTGQSLAQLLASGSQLSATSSAVTTSLNQFLSTSTVTYQTNLTNNADIVTSTTTRTGTSDNGDTTSSDANKGSSNTGVSAKVLIPGLLSQEAPKLPNSQQGVPGLNQNFPGMWNRELWGTP